MRESIKNISYCESGLLNSSIRANSSCAIARKKTGVFFDIKFFTICWIIFYFFPSPVFAAAGNVISNTATIDYFISTVPFTQESSPTGNTVTGIGNGTPTNFVEDQILNFSVVTGNGAPVNVASSVNDAFLTFTVANTGNATQDFLLTAINTAPNPFVVPPDNFDPVAPLRVFVEDGTNAGYQAVEDTDLFVDDLASGGVVTVYVVADIPAATIGDLAAVALVAQVAVGGVPGVGIEITNDDNNRISPAGTYSNGTVIVAAGTPNNIPNTAGIDIVFAEPAGGSPEDLDSTGLVQDVAGNGQNSDTGAFLVTTTGAAVDPLIKTVTVIDTLGGADPHAGATLRYQIVVNTTGASTVDNLIITDLIPADTTYTPNSITLNTILQTDIIDNPVDYSNFDGVQIIVDLSQGGTVSISTATTNTIVFDVTID